jgi:hypothetical protein
MNTESITAFVDSPDGCWWYADCFVGDLSHDRPISDVDDQPCAASFRGIVNATKEWLDNHDYAGSVEFRDKEGRVIG